MKKTSRAAFLFNFWVWPLALLFASLLASLLAAPALLRAALRCARLIKEIVAMRRKGWG